MTKLSQEILALRDQGLTYNQIVDRLECSKGTVAYHCGPGQKNKAKRRTEAYRNEVRPSPRVTLSTICENKNCDKLVTGANKFCNRECFLVSRKSVTIAVREKAIEKWRKGDWTGVIRTGDTHPGELSRWFTFWLKEQVDFTCQGILPNGTNCGWREFHPVDNRPGVQVDHIDGNNLNQEVENLQVLCLNCHWRTDIYCGRNVSNKQYK